MLEGGVFSVRDTCDTRSSWNDHNACQERVFLRSSIFLPYGMKKLQQKLLNVPWVLKFKESIVLPFQRKGIEFDSVGINRVENQIELSI